jgi:stage III sporulation protein AE
VLFNGILSGGIAKLLIPLVYAFLAMAVGSSINGGTILGKLKDTVKWLITWFLKIVLYVLTGYLSITGIVSGSTDAMALKATRLTISGMVPVVGSVLSDASEAVLVGTGVVKNAVGVYGVIALLAIWIAPFLEIGVQYLLLKLTGVLCSSFGLKFASDLIQDFATAMGLLLAMTATVCFLLLFSTVCFMRGVN